MLKQPICVKTVEEFTHEVFLEMGYGSLSVLWYIDFLHSAFGFSCPSQPTIAKKTGLGERTVSRSIKALRNMGLISTKQRWDNSLIYKVNPIVYTQEFRNKAAAWCKYFALVPLIYLTQVMAYDSVGDLVKNLSSNKYKNQTPSHSHTPLSARPRTYSRGGSPPATQGPPMSDNDLSTHFSPTLNGLKGINLTQWGKIRLSAYPDQALRYADGLLVAEGDVPDPFTWFKGACDMYCAKNNIRPAWLKVKALMEKYPAPSGSPLVIRGPMRKPAMSQETQEQQLPKVIPPAWTPPARVVEDPVIFENTMELLKRHSATSWLFSPDPCAPLNMPQYSPEMVDVIERRIAARKAARGIKV